MNEDKGVFVSDNFFFKISNGILSTEVVSLYLCWSLGSDFIFVYLLFFLMSLRNKGTKYKDIKSKLEKYTGRKWHISFIHKLVQRQKEEQYEKKITRLEESKLCLNY